MDGADWQLEDPVEVDLEDGGHEPPTPGGGGGGGRRGGAGHPARVWPWIAGLVLLLGAERLGVQALPHLDLDRWTLLVVGGALAALVAVVLGVGGLTFARLRDRGA